MSREIVMKIKNIINEIDLNGEQNDDYINNILNLIDSQDVTTSSVFTVPIIALLLNEKFGLPEIKKEVREIEKKLDKGDSSLPEIKKEIKEIEEKLDNKDFGLCEIKKEIRDIEEKLDNKDFGLCEIKKEIKEIEEKLDNKDFGLHEIKKEIKDLEKKLDKILQIVCTLTAGSGAANSNNDNTK